MSITIKSLFKSYGGKTGIADINLDLPNGALTAIVGPSGCGKTTLLRTLAGFLSPESGTILFDGKDVTKTSPQKRKASMVFQQYALWPHMSVFGNIAYGLKVQGMPASEREKEVFEILRRVEIDPTDVKKRHPQEYSGGQQQRIALARALVMRPDVLLLDEPLSNLDAKVRQRLRVEIREIQRSFGITAVYVTHDQEEALSMADYVVLMKDGSVVQAGSPEELYERPTSIFAAQFVGDSNTIVIDSEHGRDSLVIRSDEAVLCLEDRSVPDHAFSEDSLGITLRGNIVSSVYMGSYFRYLVDHKGQQFFVNDDRRLENVSVFVKIPAPKVHRFPAGELLGVG